MGSIQKNSPLADFIPDYSCYTLSLIWHCALKEMISESRLQQIMDGIFIEFAEIAEQYTKRESGSVSKEIGERLYTGALFHFDVYLLSLDSHVKAMQELVSRPTWEIFELGRKLIEIIDRDNCRIFKAAYKNRLETINRSYRHVMDKAFDLHRKHYSARFAPKELGTDLSYPLLNNRQSEIAVPGILFVRSYYTYLGYENEFCSLFDREDVKNLEAAARKAGGMFFDANIARLAANNFFINLLLGRKEAILAVTEEDRDELSESLKGLYGASIIYALEKSFAPFKDRFSSEKTYRYFFDYIPEFARILKRYGIRNGDTVTVFP